jgi:hypothetical protein
MRKVKWMILFFGMVVIHHAKAQREGDTWVLGYSSAPSTTYSMMHLDYTSGDLVVKYDPTEYSYMSETCSNICSTEGDPLLWTNGMQIRGIGNIDVLDTIAYNLPYDFYWDISYRHSKNLPGGFSSFGGALILPFPKGDSTFAVIYHSAVRDQVYLFRFVSWLQAKISFQKDSTFAVHFADSILAQSIQGYSKSINAVRHANGLDWWLFSIGWETSTYEAYLFNADGIQLHHIGDVGAIIGAGNGQTIVSTEGNFMVKNEVEQNSQSLKLSLFSIERCTGELVLQEVISLGDSISWEGAAFSPSERYLYASGPFTKVWQFDLWADDIGASKTLVGEDDGFVEPGWFPLYFGPMMQTPDGRIYVLPTAGSSRYMHVIDRPDLPADSCKFLQHHIDLKSPNGKSAPNIPNYRLGPIDGSPCDTLGIDNLATSRWRWEVNDSIDPLTIRFTDLSFYEPDTWAWDFDDGSDADIPAPIHTFPDYGLYHVCQTVENQYQRDSSCQWIELMPTVSVDDPRYVPFSIEPNPFKDELRITYHAEGFTTGEVILTDLHGVQIMHTGKIPLPITLQLDDLPPGMYICTVQEADGRMTSMKVVKGE